MAYSPLDQASTMLRSTQLLQVAARHDASAAQIALAWLLHQPDTLVIPKSINPAPIEENLAALEISLGQQDIVDLDQAFPAPLMRCVWVCVKPNLPGPETADSGPVAFALEFC